MNNPSTFPNLLRTLLEESLKSNFAELEVKFCLLTNLSKFNSGLSAEQFERLFHWLSSSNCFREVKHHEYVDYAFKNNIRGTGGLFDDRMQFITKRPRRHLDVQLSQQLGVRVSLKSEIPTSLGLGRDVGTYDSVRVKQRSSFLYKCWSFDLTKVWTGSDPLAALSSSKREDLFNFKLPVVKDRQPDSYEVEIEFLPQWHLANQPEPVAVLVESFLTRIKELAAHLGVSETDSFRLLRDLDFEAQAEAKT